MEHISRQALVADGALKLVIGGDKRPQRWGNLRSLTLKTIRVVLDGSSISMAITSAMPTSRHLCGAGSQTASAPMLQWPRATRLSVADAVLAIYHQSTPRTASQYSFVLNWQVSHV